MRVKNARAVNTIGAIKNSYSSRISRKELACNLTKMKTVSNPHPSAQNHPNPSKRALPQVVSIHTFSLLFSLTSCVAYAPFACRCCGAAAFLFLKSPCLSAEPVVTASSRTAMAGVSRARRRPANAQVVSEDEIVRMKVEGVEPVEGVGIVWSVESWIGS